MREDFQNLLALEGVRGVLLFRTSGERVHHDIRFEGGEAVETADWFALAATLPEMREVELVFQKCQVVIRRTDEAVLVVVMGRVAPSALVRLHCDILLATFRERQAVKGIKRFFSRK
jgi:hypothetical protein